MSWIQGVFPSLNDREDAERQRSRRARTRRSSVNGPLGQGIRGATESGRNADKSIQMSEQRRMNGKSYDKRSDSSTSYDYYYDSYGNSGSEYGDTDNASVTSLHDADGGGDARSVDSVSSFAGAGYNWLFGTDKKQNGKGRDRHRRRRRRRRRQGRDRRRGSHSSGGDTNGSSPSQHTSGSELDYKLEGLDPRDDIEDEHALNAAARGPGGINFANIVQMLQKAQPSARARIERSLATSSASVARQAARIGDVSSRIVTSYDASLRRCNLSAFLLGLLSIVCMMLHLEVLNVKGEDSTLTLVLHLFISITTVLLVTQVVFMYTVLVKYEAKVQGLPTASLFNQKQLLWPCLGEVAFLLLHWPPAVGQITDSSGNVILDYKFNLFLFLRIYLFLRVMRDHSAIYQYRKDLVKHGYKSMVLSKFDWKMSLRSQFYRNSQIFALVTTLVAFPIVSYATYVLERDSNPAVSTMTESLWLTAVTMTTVGFGDVVPITIGGKVLAMIGAVCGIMLTAILIAVITQKLTLSNQQVYAINWLSRNKYFELERMYATRLIQHTWRLYLNRKANPFMASKREHKDYLVSRSLIRHLHAAKHQRLHYETQSSDYTLDSTFQILEESKIRHSELTKRLGDMQQVQLKAFDKLDHISARLTERMDALVDARRK